MLRFRFDTTLILERSQDEGSPDEPQTVIEVHPVVHFVLPRDLSEICNLIHRLGRVIDPPNTPDSEGWTDSYSRSGELARLHSGLVLMLGLPVKDVGTEERMILRTIWDDPGERTGWLAYVDYLDEIGSPRASIIREWDREGSEVKEYPMDDLLATIYRIPAAFGADIVYVYNRARLDSLLRTVPIPWTPDTVG